jgi:hypothetical protein
MAFELPALQGLQLLLQQLVLRYILLVQHAANLLEAGLLLVLGERLHGWGLALV